LSADNVAALVHIMIVWSVINFVLLAGVWILHRLLAADVIGKVIGGMVLHRLPPPVCRMIGVVCGLLAPVAIDQRLTSGLAGSGKLTGNITGIGYRVTFPGIIVFKGLAFGD